jgi:class 3 adenylate cyclase
MPVSCPSCGHANPAEARFCNTCGARLEAPAAPPEPRAYTPRHLAEKILASKSALEGERKPVTVLFADVARSMELAERIDPEEWHRLLDRLFRILADGVHRYEGTINQYTGDGIMALFGAPIAHEDHAQRGCAAALAMAGALGELAEGVRRESGLELAVRRGLNSGEVVVGRIGDDLRMDYTAQGHVVGLAARVQQLAPPGGISLTEQTARLVSGFFDLRDRGEHRLKGASAPVRVFDLRGPGPIRSRLQSARARGFSRFAGRHGELGRLERALRDAGAGRPRVVLITGEPGAGKSRLCHEPLERSRGVALHHARALSHGRVLPFHLIVELARSLLDVGEGASAPDLGAAVARGLAGAPSVDPVALAFWLELLGVPDPARPPSELEPEARSGGVATGRARCPPPRPGISCGPGAERLERGQGRLVPFQPDEPRWTTPCTTRTCDSASRTALLHGRHGCLAERGLEHNAGRVRSTAHRVPLELVCVRGVPEP